MSSSSLQSRLGEHTIAIEYLVRFRWRTEQVKGKAAQILESLLEIAFPCILRLRPGWIFVIRGYPAGSQVPVTLKESSVRIMRDQA